MSQRKATAAEISLVHLKNCLVNLPASLVSLLVTVNTVRIPPCSYFNLSWQANSADVAL